MDTGIDSLQQLKKFYDEILKFFKFQKTPNARLLILILLQD